MSGRRAKDGPAPELAWLERRLLRPVLGLVTRLVHPEAAPRRSAPRRELGDDLLLALGHGAVRLFSRGPIDELTFFQRTDVPCRHDLEFVTRGSVEAFEGHALLRLDRPAADAPLPSIRSVEARWAALREAHGLTGLPRPEPAPGTDGLNRVAARGCAQVDEVRRRLSQAETLTLLRTELSTLERIAWVEAAFRGTPPAGCLVHRYYLDAEGTPWLVRHDRGGKRVIRAERVAGRLAIERRLAAA